MERVYKVVVLNKTRYCTLVEGKMTETTKEAYDAWKNGQEQPAALPTAKERAMAFGKRHGISFGADMDEDTLKKAGW